MLKLENVTKKFKNITAVDQISFSADKGEVIGLLGPNGAGKTTTMRLITSYLSPTQGRILVEEKDVAKEPSFTKKRIGYLPEGNPLYKELKTLEMLELTAQLKEINLTNENLKKIICSAGLAQVLDRPVGELSKGYRQRLGLACALLGDPEILILDEPTEGLDPNQRHEIRQLIKAIGKNRTVLLSTHVMEEVEAICQRVIIINKGKIISDGSLSQLKSQTHGNSLLHLTIGHQAEIGQIREINGVKEVKEKSSEQEKKILEIAVEATHPIQPELTRLAGQHGWTIWELTEQKASLEEVFRELTRG